MLPVGDTPCDIVSSVSRLWSALNDQCRVRIHLSRSTGVYLDVLSSFCSAAEKYPGFGSVKPFLD